LISASVAFFDLLVGGLHSFVVGLGSFDLVVSVERRQHRTHDVGQRRPAGRLDDFLLLRFGETLVEPGQPTGQRRHDVLIGAAEGDGFQEFFERHGRLAFQRTRFGLCSLADPDGIDDDEVVLGLCVGGDGLEVGVGDDADAPPLHLLEERAALDAAHEEHDFQRLDVRAGGDHVHGDDNAGVVVDTKVADQVFRVFAGRAIGDLLAEVVAASELLADDLDDVLAVGIVLGEDDCLGNVGPAWEDFGEQLVAEGADARRRVTPTAFRLTPRRR